MRDILLEVRWSFSLTSSSICQMNFVFHEMYTRQHRKTALRRSHEDETNRLVLWPSHHLSFRRISSPHDLQHNLYYHSQPQKRHSYLLRVQPSEKYATSSSIAEIEAKWKVANGWTNQSCRSNSWRNDSSKRALLSQGGKGLFTMAHTAVEDRGRALLGLCQKGGQL